MTNTQSFALTELDVLCKSAARDNRPVIEPFIPEILALCEKFGNSGQSGGSAPYVAGALADAINKLCLQEPICPITGSEWVEVADGLFQNARCSAAFKNQDGPYYLYAIAWRTQSGSTWNGSAYTKAGERIRSRQRIKEFPFTPKTFVIDVIEEEVAPDDWKFTIVDHKQLEEVFEYYEKLD